MAVELIVYGHFAVPYSLSANGTKTIESSHAREFWAAEKHKPFQRKRGIYIFGVQAGRGYKPLYVGKATKSFRQECFTPHKLHHYVAGLSDVRRGSPVLFFISASGNKNHVSVKVVEEVERAMIQFAILKNPDLRNVKNTRPHNWSIRGLIRSNCGRPPSEARRFGKMMGLL